MRATIKHRSINCLYFIAVLFATTMSATGILANKIVATSFGEFTASSLISPFWFMLTDVIAEIYGYQVSKNIFSSVVFCQFLFALTCFLLIKLPSPAWWHEQHSYDIVTGHLLRITFFSLIGIIVAWRTNTYLLLKWKILTRGKYFWLRCLGSSSIGEIIFSIFSVGLSVLGEFSHAEEISFVLWSCALKLIGLIILAPISTYIVALIRHLEGPVDDNQAAKLNPFVVK